MSLHDDIAEADKVLAAAAVPLATVAIRQEAWRIEEDPFPLVIITLGDDRDVQIVFGGIIQREYEVLLTVIYQGNFQLQTGLDAPVDAREVIRQALMPDVTTSPPVVPGSVSGVTDVRTSGSWKLDHGTIGYNVARLLLTYTTSERLRG